MTLVLLRNSNRDFFFLNLRCRVCAHPGPTAIRGGDWSRGGPGVSAETRDPTLDNAAEEDEEE